MSTQTRKINSPCLLGKLGREFKAEFKYLAPGELPPGLTWDGTTISGIPTQSGRYRLASGMVIEIEDGGLK